MTRTVFRLSRLVRGFALAVVLFAVVLVVCGCQYSGQPGETAAEGHRRHLRTWRLDGQGMMADIDTMLLTDKPSTLTDMRVP